MENNIINISAVIEFIEDNLTENPAKSSEDIDWQNDIRNATEEDIHAWMKFVKLVADGFHCINEKDYLEQLKKFISKNQAYLMEDGEIIIGALKKSKRD